jgi:hypothetical protein
MRDKAAQNRLQCVLGLIVCTAPHSVQRQRFTHTGWTMSLK